MATTKDRGEIRREVPRLLLGMEDQELRRRKSSGCTSTPTQDQAGEVPASFSSGSFLDTLMSPLFKKRQENLQDSGFQEQMSDTSDCPDLEVPNSDVEIPTVSDSRKVGERNRSYLAMVGPPLLVLVIMAGAIGFGLLIPNKPEEGELNGKYESIQFAALRKGKPNIGEVGTKHLGSDLKYDPDEPKFRSMISEDLGDDYLDEESKPMTTETIDLDYPDDPKFRPVKASAEEVADALNVDYPDDPKFRSMYEDYPDDPKFRSMYKDYPDNPEFRLV